MISEKPKFIFIHLEKCAGNSIMYALREYSSTGYQIISPPASYSKTLGININDHPTFKIKAHPNLSDYEKQYNLNEYYVWTCIRNPWDRALSAYLYWNNHKFQSSDFINFFSQPHVYNSSLASYEIKLRSIKGPAWGPEINFIRYENLEEDFNKTCNRLKITGELPHLNDSILTTGSYKDYYTPGMINIIAKHYKEDIDKFSYTF